MSGPHLPEDTSGPVSHPVDAPAGTSLAAAAQDPFLAFASESEDSPPGRPTHVPRSHGADPAFEILDVTTVHDQTFASEGPSEVPRARPAPEVASWPRRVGIVLVAALAIAGGAAGFFQITPLDPPENLPIPAGASTPSTQPPAAVAESTARIDSRPQGALVLIDGVVRGVTPLSLSLPVGAHAMELQRDGETRSLPLTIETGTTAAQYVELDPPPPTASGRLDVTSAPSGATVSIDGTPRGVTPLLLGDLPPGPHTIVVSNNDEVITKPVTVTAGATSTVVAAFTNGPSLIGWVSIVVPFEMRIVEGGRFAGTTKSERIALTEGPHALELSSVDPAFRTSLTATITRAKVSRMVVPLPKGTLAITAVPWADVTLDGRALGRTPLAATAVAIGPHEIVWRHPQFGERRETLMVTSSGQAQATVDFTKEPAPNGRR